MPHVFEELTKEYDSRLLISGTTHNALKNPQQFQLRFIDKVQVRGKLNEIEILEVYSADPKLAFRENGYCRTI